VRITLQIERGILQEFTSARSERAELRETVDRRTRRGHLEICTGALSTFDSQRSVFDCSSDRNSRRKIARVNSLMRQEIVFSYPKQKWRCAVHPYFPQSVLAWSLSISRARKAAIATRENRISSNEHAH
jgi:hypothetical protein